MKGTSKIFVLGMLSALSLHLGANAQRYYNPVYDNQGQQSYYNSPYDSNYGTNPNLNRGYQGYQGQLNTGYQPANKAPGQNIGAFQQNSSNPNPYGSSYYNNTSQPYSGSYYTPYNSQNPYTSPNYAPSASPTPTYNTNQTTNPRR